MPGARSGRRLSLPVQPRRAARRRVDSRHQAVEPVRLGPLPDQRGLAGVLDRIVFAAGNPVHHPAHTAVGPDLHDGHADGRRANHPAAHRPFYPHAFAAAHGVDGQDLNVRYRCVVCRNRDNTDTNDAWQVVAGAKGTAWNWDFDGSFNYSENTSKEKPNAGFFRYTQIVPLLNSGVVNLFGPNPDAVQQQVDSLSYTQEAANSKLKGYGIDIKGSGDIYKMDAGPLALALGLQAGKETLTQSFNPLLQVGDLTGYGGNLQDIDHSRTVWAVFGELNIPILKTLEGNIAVRYDHYSDFGSTTNPKVSLRWQPVPSLLLRGSWGTGFLAPSLYQLWTPVTPGLSQNGVSDPLAVRIPTLRRTRATPTATRSSRQSSAATPT